MLLWRGHACLLGRCMQLGKNARFPVSINSEARAISASAQSSDLLVEDSKSLLKNCTVARILHRVELLQNPATGEFQAFFAGFACSLFGCQMGLRFRCRPGVVLLKLNRLTFPTACHVTIIRVWCDERTLLPLRPHRYPIVPGVSLGPWQFVFFWFDLGRLKEERQGIRSDDLG